MKIAWRRAAAGWAVLAALGTPFGTAQAQEGELPPKAAKLRQILADRRAFEDRIAREPSPAAPNIAPDPASESADPPGEEACWPEEFPEEFEDPHIS